MTKHKPYSIEDIIALVTEKYKDPRRPMYSFVRQTINQDPYRALIDRLGSRFEVEDDTDTNVDVCFGLALKYRYHVWGLNLSMVGPFALFWRAFSQDEFQPVDRTSPTLLAEEQYVIEELDAFAITLMNDWDLHQRIPFCRVNREETTAELHQCLFSDLDFLPWE